MAAPRQADAARPPRQRGRETAPGDRGLVDRRQQQRQSLLGPDRGRRARRVRRPALGHHHLPDRPGTRAVASRRLPEEGAVGPPQPDPVRRRRGPGVASTARAGRAADRHRTPQRTRRGEVRTRRARRLTRSGSASRVAVGSRAAPRPTRRGQRPRPGGCRDRPLDPCLGAVRPVLRHRTCRDRRAGGHRLPVRPGGQHRAVARIRGGRRLRAAGRRTRPRGPRLPRLRRAVPRRERSRVRPLPRRLRPHDRHRHRPHTAREPRSAADPADHPRPAAPARHDAQGAAAAAAGGRRLARRDHDRCFRRAPRVVAAAAAESARRGDACDGDRARRRPPGRDTVGIARPGRTATALHPCAVARCRGRPRRGGRRGRRTRRAVARVGRRRGPRRRRCRPRPGPLPRARSCRPARLAGHPQRLSRPPTRQPGSRRHHRLDGAADVLPAARRSRHRDRRDPSAPAATSCTTSRPSMPGRSWTP